MKIFLVAVLVFALSGCGAIGGKIQEVVTNDLTRTSEIAAKYGKPDVKQCADFLNTALNSEDSRLGQLDAILKEPTSGLLSIAVKAAIIADLTRSLQDPALQAKFEADFNANCGKVSGAIMLDIARVARKGATRGAF